MEDQETNQIPTAETISAAWFTQQLRNAGMDVSVAGFSAQQVGTGQIGKCIRYTLEYSHGNGPASLVGKFPSDDPTSRATGVVLRNFFKEVRFYQHMQSRLQIRTPRCYYAQIEGEGPQFAILMEDLAPAVQGDQLKGCDADVAEAAVLQLVGLHAPLWCQTELFDIDWLVPAATAEDDAMQNLYAAQLDGFLARYGARLAQDEQDIIAAVAKAPSAPLFRRNPDPFSLVHIDYRLDNLLIQPVDRGHNITVVDWQSISVGAPLNDVAYFLGAGMLPDARRLCEESIVRAYYDALCAQGIEGFSWEQCWDLYHQGTFAGFGVTVIASMLVQQTQRGDDMFVAMASRHARHALDHDGHRYLA